MKQPLVDDRLRQHSQLDDCLRSEVNWTSTAEGEPQWRAQMGQDTWTVRVNDFPEEHLYTLFINGEELGNFDDWPQKWLRLV